MERLLNDKDIVVDMGDKITEKTFPGSIAVNGEGVGLVALERG